MASGYLEYNVFTRWMYHVLRKAVLRTWDPSFRDLVVSSHQPNDNR